LYYAHQWEKVDVDVANLFEVYHACKDSKFVSHMHRKNKEWVDLTLTLMYEKLMDMALKQYQTMVHEKTWETNHWIIRKL
jgi:hypothetical protein